MASLVQLHDGLRERRPERRTRSVKVTSKHRSSDLDLDHERDGGHSGDDHEIRILHNDTGYSNLNLMAQSREQLTMDMNLNSNSNSKAEHSIFSRPAGCYVSRSKGLAFLGVFVLIAVGVGFLTYHLTAPCGVSPPLSGGAGGGGGGATGGTEGDGGPESESGGPKKVRDVRLPLNVRPIHYKVDLVPHINPAKNFTLEGTVTIDILCVEPTNRITLHIKNVTIKESSVRVSEKFNETQPGAGVGNAKALNIKNHAYDVDREFYNLTVGGVGGTAGGLEAGKRYAVYIEYTGILSDELSGFYRSSYVDKTSNETRWLAVTQFQPTDARRAFPCFDEPGFKAEFEVSIARLENMSSISNMDLRSSEPVSDMPGWIWDHYNRSVPMSTYLVAFVVSDFERLISDPSLSRPKFQVWARRDAIDQAEYARDIGPRILSYYEEYFDINFPLPKQDMIALPDFGAGAMENWGLITYRETAMLFDPKVSSDQNKQRVAVVIAHELAHQWFGNLVTPAWWNGLWLNEGFASYVEYIGVDHVQPDWKILDQFVTDEVQDVFGLDALDSSHPISVGVDHPDEINEIFDSISYAKGASILRMMSHFLTQSTFNKGLTNYLNKWKFGNTEQDNLWDSLTEQAHADRTLDIHMRVGEVMHTYTLQKGFPVIHVERNYPLKTATFSQAKFSLIKNDNFTEEYKKYSWWVPISYASTSFNSDFNGTNPQFWIPKGSPKYDHDVHVAKNEWLVVNVQETGYYRVNYDMKNWNLLIEQLNSDPTAIHTVNRAQILDDALNLAKAQLLPYDVAFNVTQFLKKDDEYLPWEAFLNNLQYIYSMLLRTESFGTFKKYNRELISEQYVKVGIDEKPTDGLLRKYHRINVVQTACSVGHAPCVENAKQLFGTWVNKSSPDTDNPIPMNLRRSIYCNGIRYGGEAEWNFLWERYLSANVASEKTLILQALACSRETWILNRYLQWAITPGSEIRKQDSRIVLSAVANNDIGNFLAFNFLRDKWVTIRKYFGTGFSMGGFVKSISGKFNTEFELTELRNFKKANEHDLGSAARAVDQSIERVQANIEWMNNNFKTISDWLESQIS